MTDSSSEYWDEIFRQEAHRKKQVLTAREMVEEVFREDNACEADGHEMDTLGVHGGEVIWYATSTCPNCGNAGTVLVCESMHDNTVLYEEMVQVQCQQCWNIGMMSEYISWLKK